MRKRRNKTMGKHTYIIYPIKGADITIEADRYCSYCENGCIRIEFHKVRTVDEHTKVNYVVALFNLNNIVGFERID